MNRNIKPGNLEISKQGQVNEMNFYFNEKEWDFKQAEMAKNLERIRLLKEAKAARKAEKALRKQTGMNFNENINTQKVGKETLGWN